MTDYISKINANSTNYIVGGDILDGQWVKSNYSILSNATLAGGSNFTYSLSSYLPNDSYDYEILVSGQTRSGTKSGNVCQLELYSGSDTAFENGWRLARAVARKDSNVFSGGCALVPIYANDRNITVRTTDATTNNTGVILDAVGYRRIGTNNDTLTNKISKITSNNTTRALGGKIADSGVTYFTTQQTGLYTSSSSDEYNMIDSASLTIAAGDSSTYSLSNIMPNDGYDYELLLSVYSRVSTEGKYIDLKLSYGDGILFVGQRIARTSSMHRNFQTLWVPVSASDKSITMSNAGNGSATYNIKVHGYRRVGTNSTTKLYAYINTQNNILVYSLKPIPDNGDMGYDLTSSFSSHKEFLVDNGSVYVYVSSNVLAQVTRYSGLDINAISNINGYTIGGYNFDGEWVLSYQSLMQSETLSATSKVTYDLSSYLPNDGKDYMVAFGGWGRTGTSSGYDCAYYFMSGNQTYDNTVKWGVRMMITEFHSTSSYSCSGNLMIPILASDRNVTFANKESKATGNSGLYAIGYRRIGTNE